MKAKQWASWLLAGLMALGQAPLAANAVTTGVVTVTQTEAVAAPATTQSAVPATETAPTDVAPGVSAQTITVLTRVLARREVLALQPVLNASLDAKKAYEDWQNSILRADQLDTEKVVVKNPFTGENIDILFSDNVQMQLQMSKYLQPMQLELQYLALTRAVNVTTHSLENAMDSLLLGLHAAQNDILSRERSKAVAEQTLARTEASFAAGRVLQIDVDTDALALRKAEAALRAAKRSRENLVRSYNKFVGKPIERDVQVRLTPDGTLPNQAADDYVLTAMNDRLELFQKRGTILLLEKQAEIMTFRDLHVNDPDVRLDRENVLLQAEQTRLQLARDQRQITAEIRAAYLRLKVAELDITSTRNTLAQQRERLATIQSNMKAGRLPAYADDALLAGIADLEAGIVTARLSLDNDIRKFRQAAGYGPGQQ